MNKGDIILVPFPFSDLTGNKLRPALVLISREEDVTVAFITTQLQWKEETDLLLQPSVLNGLKKQSLVRLTKLATIDTYLAEGRLGEMDKESLQFLNVQLKKVLQLD